MGPRDEDRRSRAARKIGRPFPWLRIILVAIFVIGLLLIDLIIGYLTVDSSEDTTIREITQAPNTYIGQNITIRGAAKTVIGERTFTIGDENFVRGAGLLVVSVNEFVIVDGHAANTSILENDIVEATGSLRLFGVAAFENAIGVDLVDAALEPFAGQPAVLAQSIHLTPRVTGISVTAIISNVTRFACQLVTVKGRVEQVLGEYVLALDADGRLEGEFDDNLLVVAAQAGLPAIDEELSEATVVVRGTVHEFDLPELESELGYDLDDDLLAEWAGQTVLIATVIQKVG